MAEIRDRGSVLATEEGIQVLKNAKAAMRNYEDKPLTYKNIGDKSGVSDKTVERFFKGKQPIDESTARSICQALGVEFNNVVEARLSVDTSDNQEYRINWRERCAKAKESKLDWQGICRDVLELQHKHWLTSHPLGTANRRVPDVYVPLGLIERQPKPRMSQDFAPENWSVREQEETIKLVSHQDFFDSILRGQSPKSKGKRIALIGEPGAGKTMLLQKICTKIDGVPIWIDLASLKQGDTLEEYLLRKWLKSSLSVIRGYSPGIVPNLLEPSTELKQSFTELFEQNEVWLLLDGVDEMASELGQPLNWVAQQIRQPGWIAKAKVVLTSRLNLWSDDGDRLVEFDAYRNLDFEPENVTAFIDKWFVEAPDSSEKLKEDLASSSDRIQSLIRNPLRLTLLCLTWKGVGDRLPETKAGLYRRLADAHYKWKDGNQEFVIDPDKREQLHQKLGELSKAALDSKEARFRLRQSFIVNFLGKPDRNHSLFWWAIKLGWLNQIGLPSVDEDNADEPVYAFLHPTFQEYFAALAIDDWDFFLPREHDDSDPKPVKNKRYRVFESQWREAFLIWCGRTDICKEAKLLVNRLINFQGGCSSFHFYAAFFFAANALSELGNSDVSKEIIEDLINLSFFTRFEPTEALDKYWLHCPIQEQARETLQLTERSTVVKELLQAISITENPHKQRDLAESLGEISPRNTKSIEILTQLLNNIEHKYTVIDIAKSLWFTDPGNLDAVDKFIELLSTDEEDIVSQHAAQTIWMNNIQFPEIVSALINLAKKNGNDFTSWSREFLRGLEKFGVGDRYVIDTIADLIEIANIEQKHENQRVLIWVLGEVGLGDLKASNYLIKLLDETDDQPSRWLIAGSLGRIGINHLKIVSTLTDLASQHNHEWTRQQAAESLLRIIPDHSDALNLLIDLLQTTTSWRTQRRVIISLEEIAVGNSLAIKTLSQFLEVCSNEYILEQAAETLGKIDPGNKQAINVLIQLFENEQNKPGTNRAIIWKLGDIGKDNLNAIKSLTQFFERRFDNIEEKSIKFAHERNLSGVPRSLCKIMTDASYRLVIQDLKKYISQEMYENDFDHFTSAYEIVWYCAQNMSYPNFYRAWHAFDTDTKLSTE
jgi:HEAT repeat protein/transcriptional regulator with XRE-family HTH domain